MCSAARISPRWRPQPRTRSPGAGRTDIPNGSRVVTRSRECQVPGGSPESAGGGSGSRRRAEHDAPTGAPHLRRPPGLPIVGSGGSSPPSAGQAGRARCNVADLEGRGIDPRFGSDPRRLRSVALISAGIGLITSSAHALEILVMTTIVLWGAATLRHVFTIPPER